MTTDFISPMLQRGHFVKPNQNRIKLLAESHRLQTATITYIERRRRGVFVETAPNQPQAPSERHIRKISLVTELFILVVIFYKDVSPDGLQQPGWIPISRDICVVC
jgi:hypothetical protein